MASRQRRSYDQFCAVARALDHVSERWTLLIVRNLMLGPRRYSDLMAELPGITTNLLAARLKAMEASGVVAREEGPPSRYALTPLGTTLIEALRLLCLWAQENLGAVEAARQIHEQQTRSEHGRLGR